MLALVILSSLLCADHAHSVMTAKARIHLDSQEETIGYLLFTQAGINAPVIIQGTLANMPPNAIHGFHVHDIGLADGELNCTAAGPHFNPYSTKHGPRSADITSRHVGDLGNVTSNSVGNVHINLEDSIIQLFNATQSIANRTIVLHRMRDDGGTGGFPDSSTTGNAGARVACGTIMLTKTWWKQ